MSRLLKRLALMLAVAVLTVMPTVAQATPHYYKNNPPTVEYPEGQRIPFIAWGRLSISLEPPIPPITACESMAAGWIENPVGGGAGVGETLRFATWNCTEEECPQGEIEIEGNKYEKEFEISAPPQTFPWPSVLTEVEPGVIRTNSAEVVWEVGCFAHRIGPFSSATANKAGPKPTRLSLGEGGPNGGGINEQFELFGGGTPTVTCVTIPGTNEQKPEAVNGAQLGGPGNAKLRFGGGFANNGSGSLSCAGGSFEIKIKESMKIMGYKGSELINVR